jgi:hypothetical protein
MAAPLMAAGRRRAATVTAIGLACLAGLGASGCSDSDVGGPEDAAGAGSLEVFCSDFQDLEDEFSDPESDASAADVAEALAALDPPDEIADEVDTFAEGVAASEGVDPNDPANAQQVTELQEAFAAVDEFRSTECDTGGDAGSDAGG